MGDTETKEPLNARMDKLRAALARRQVASEVERLVMAYGEAMFEFGECDLDDEDIHDLQAECERTFLAVRQALDVFVISPQARTMR
jgi:hypothetical protein